MATLDQKTFSKLRKLYIIALSLIALSVVASQVLVRKFLNDQTADSTVINIAGRQRMLSQKITKEALLLTRPGDSAKIQALQDSLSATRTLWHNSHLALQNGSDSLHIPAVNTARINQLFDQINPYFESVYAASAQLLSAENTTDVTSLSALNTILANEAPFLRLMDRIVNQYQYEADAKIERLRTLEVLLMGLTLLLLLAEFIFIFWPTAKAVRTGMFDLITAERKAQKMARDADALAESKEKLLWEYQALSQAMDRTLFFVRTDLNGNILHAGDPFIKLFKPKNLEAQSRLSDVISTHEPEKQRLEQLLNEHKRTGWQGEISATPKEGNRRYFEMSLLPFLKHKENHQLLIIFIDITKRKEAHDEIERLTKSHFEERISQQKNVSRQIIENQEREQNRIARDLHDGIGQMLTGLKFTLESIDLKDPEKAQAKITHLKNLSLDIIKGIRTATFNLTPPELTDHGLIPALAKLTKELSNLTGKHIQLHNKTDFNLRLDSLVEINTYRITQEAINNALKYAGSKIIMVSVRHSKSMLSITIDDDGKGFDPSGIDLENREGGGMGMTFMHERMNYINGRLFVNSEPGKGTRIVLNIPID